MAKKPRVHGCCASNEPRARREGGGEEDGKQGTARHVKLTNRSGLAGFRIPRVIGRDPVARSGTVVSPRSTARPVGEGKGRCNPLFHARCPSAYISGAHPGPEIRFSTIPAAEDHHARGEVRRHLGGLPDSRPGTRSIFGVFFLFSFSSFFL